MMGNAGRRAILSAVVILNGVVAFAQTPFQFPTANHSLYQVGEELKDRKSVV